MHHEIEFKEVYFSYPRSKFTLENINFKIKIGSKFAICGPNGAGKTTILKLLLGLLKPNKGQIKVQELTLNEKTVDEARKRVGFVFQNPDVQVFSASVYEDVAFGPRNLGLDEKEVRERVEKALEDVGMLENIDESPFQLSFGQRKRVAIAGILAMDPAIIVFDEPFANLDWPTSITLQKLLEDSVLKRGKTIIFASHSRYLVQSWSDEILLLNKGKIEFYGKTEELKKYSKANEILGPMHI